jgi:hypothetical protein
MVAKLPIVEDVIALSTLLAATLCTPAGTMAFTIRLATGSTYGATLAVAAPKLPAIPLLLDIFGMEKLDGCRTNALKVE